MNSSFCLKGMPGYWMIHSTYKGVNIRIFKQRCTSVPEECFYFSKLFLFFIFKQIKYKPVFILGPYIILEDTGDNHVDSKHVSDLLIL